MHDPEHVLLGLRPGRAYAPRRMRACPRCLSVFFTEAEFCSFDGERLTSDQVLLGRYLKEYRLEALLGTGATGCVYQATHKNGQKCALKLFFGELAADKNIATRFRREAEAASKIKHPNVVTLLDFGTTSAGLVYLAMELVEGRTLKQILESEAPLLPRRAGHIAERLAAGLSEAHRQGYVHRDLKPGNVMVAGDPSREIVKVLDFGIVASLYDRRADDRLTKTGYLIGTPTYMAPEQIDPEAVSPQVDVYALGVILYEMLAGKPPFSGTLEQVLVAKMTRSPPPLEGDLGKLAMEMLEVDPSRRPPSALFVSAALARLSLLSEDPATVRAGVPHLPTLAEVGFGLGTVRVWDSGPTNDAPLWHQDGLDVTPPDGPKETPDTQPVSMEQRSLGSAKISDEVDIPTTVSPPPRFDSGWRRKISSNPITVASVPPYLPSAPSGPSEPTPQAGAVLQRNEQASEDGPTRLNIQSQKKESAPNLSPPPTPAQLALESGRFSGDHKTSSGDITGDVFISPLESMERDTTELPAAAVAAVVRPPVAPPSVAKRHRWWWGVVFAVLTVSAACATYWWLEQKNTVIIDVSPPP